MVKLKKQLLASIEVHGKCDIYGLLNLYPHETKWRILRALFTLRNEGWIRINKTQVIDGDTYPRPNVKRTQKQMYRNLELFDQL